MEGRENIMNRLMTFAACLMLTGCADWSRETKVEESAYQVLGVVDTIQTYHATQRPECYGEGDPVTSFVIGNHPKPGSVIAWGVVRAGLHAWVTDWMVRDDASPMALRIWQGLSIGIETYDVGRNWNIGLRFGSAKPPSYAPCLRSRS
jgi:hypothetical protein